MSYGFGNNNINQFKAQSAYKDASGMGGGGMYFKQKKKDKEDEDLFEHSTDDNTEDSIFFDKEVKKEDIPQDTLFNKFVNWFRIQKD
ncbi:MAG: hypothetical protein MJ231_01705 [bacterium]|nr:hypothetical protein [bacterium]